MKKILSKRIKFTTYLDPTLMDGLERLAEKARVSKNAVIRRLLVMELERERERQKQEQERQAIESTK